MFRFMKKLSVVKYSFLALLLTGWGACENGTLPQVTTLPVTNITSTTAESGGTVDRLDGTPPQEWGLCWSTSPGATVANFRSKESVNRSTTFLSSMEGLSPSTRYYVRAYSINQSGVAYGNELSFNTLP
jgi:hypothetical protein